MAIWHALNHSDAKGYTPHTMTVELLPAALPPQPATCASLASLPAGAGAVCWSEDNLLAVATSRSVVLLSAADLDGPRAIIDVPLTQVARTDGAQQYQIHRNVVLLSQETQ